MKQIFEKPLEINNRINIISNETFLSFSVENKHFLIKKQNGIETKFKKCIENLLQTAYLKKYDLNLKTILSFVGKLGVISKRNEMRMKQFGENT